MLMTLCEPTSTLSSASPLFTWLIAPRGSVAELPEAIRPPTFDLMSIEERTGMEKTSGDLEGRTSRAQIDNRERIAHLAGSYSAANSIFQSELTRIIAAPTFHLSIIEKRTAVSEAQSDVLCATARSKIYRRQGIAHLVSLVAAVGPCLPTPAAQSDSNPTLELSVIEQCTAMGSASGDINRHTPDAQIHRCEKITHLVGGRSTHRSVSKAKLAEVIPTPAFD